MSDDSKNYLHDILATSWFYYMPVLFVIGTIANCLCVFVPRRTEMKNIVSRYYFIAMTISNEAWIIFIGISWIVANVNDVIFIKRFCIFSFYIPTALRFLSMYFVLAFVVERYHAVRIPPRQQKIRTTQIITFGITILGFLLAAFTFTVTQSDCRVLNNGHYWYMLIMVMNAFIINIVPFTIIIILSTRIFAVIRQPTTMGCILTHTTNGTNEAPAGQWSLSIPSVKETRITKMLIIVAIEYTSLNLLSNLLVVLFSLELFQSYSIILVSSIILITNFISGTSLGLNLFICCVVDEDFRRAALATILCRRQTEWNSSANDLYTRVNPQPNAPPLMTSTGD